MQKTIKQMTNIKRENDRRDRAETRERRCGSRARPRNPILEASGRGCGLRRALRSSLLCPIQEPHDIDAKYEIIHTSSGLPPQWLVEALISYMDGPLKDEKAFGHDSESLEYDTEGNEVGEQRGSLLVCERCGGRVNAPNGSQGRPVSNA